MSYAEIEEKARTIITLCGNQAYCSLTGDRRLEYVPPEAMVAVVWTGQRFSNNVRAGLLLSAMPLRKTDRG